MEGCAPLEAAALVVLTTGSRSRLAELAERQGRNWQIERREREE